CRELGTPPAPTTPLGGGSLPGHLPPPADSARDDFRRNNPRFQGENFQKNLELVEKVGALASRKGCTPGQLALAWVMAQGDDVVPIPGTKRRKNLAENLGAFDVHLGREDLTEVEAVLQRGAGIRAR